MNIQFYTWRAGAENAARPSSPAPFPKKAFQMEKSNYDQVDFSTREDTMFNDPEFARMLAKKVIGGLAGSAGSSPERIAQLRRQIAEGSYHPDDMAIAKAMIGR